MVTWPAIGKSIRYSGLYGTFDGVLDKDETGYKIKYRSSQGGPSRSFLVQLENIKPIDTIKLRPNIPLHINGVYYLSKKLSKSMLHVYKCVRETARFIRDQWHEANDFYAALQLIIEEYKKQKMVMYKNDHTIEGFEMLPNDVLVEILMKTSPEDLSNFCLSSKRIDEICQTKFFKKAYEMNMYKDLYDYMISRYFVYKVVYGKRNDVLFYTYKFKLSEHEFAIINYRRESFSNKDQLDFSYHNNNIGLFAFRLKYMFNLMSTDSDLEDNHPVAPKDIESSEMDVTKISNISYELFVRTNPDDSWSMDVFKQEDEIIANILDIVNPQFKHLYDKPLSEILMNLLMYHKTMKDVAREIFLTSGKL